MFTKFIIFIKNYYLYLFVFAVGLLLRFWNIGFGLPHSYYADEPELSGFAIHYSVELKNAFLNDSLYELVPVSYIYGTFPSYFLVPFLIVFQKLSSLVNIHPNTGDLYLFIRYLLSFFSIMLVPIVSYLYYLLFKDKKGTFISFLLLSLNWKLIAHGHYANADIILTLLLSISFLFSYYYFLKKSDTFFTILMGVFFGFSVGTKITALITLPLYLYLFIVKKDIRGLIAFCFITFGIFILTNPFSLIFINDFIYRIYTMFTLEAGLVFDSVDYSVFKYLFGLSFMLTFPILISSLLGIFKNFKHLNKEVKPFHIFLLLNLLIYFLFYSFQSRRVDRWLLPILPLLIIYSSYYISFIIEKFKRYSFITYGILGLIFTYYFYMSFTLLYQFNENTPKSLAYLWLRDNAVGRAYHERVLSYTEEGLDPLSKLKYAVVLKFKLYESLGASLFYPEDPYYYKYIVVSSRTMNSYKNPIIMINYPNYYSRWLHFENTLKGPDFRLVFSKIQPEPNLIPLSSVYIYENIRFSEFENLIKLKIQKEKMN